MKKVLVERVETINGILFVRMLKIDGEVAQYHRTSLDADTDPEAQRQAVNSHLAMMGYPEVEGWEHVIAAL